MQARPSVEANAFSKHINDIHDDDRRKIAISNENYKAHVDLKRKFVDLKRKFADFKEGDMVMVSIRPNKLQLDQTSRQEVENLEIPFSEEEVIAIRRFRLEG